MAQYGTWVPYSGSEALLLAFLHGIVAGIMVYLGTRLHRAVAVTRPGTTVGILLVVIWFFAPATFLVAILAYIGALFQLYGAFTPPTSPITPVTVLSALGAFIVILYLTRRHGLKIALGSAIVGTIAAPMIFELLFDLIVMWRTYAPMPTAAFILLFYYPLFTWEISSFALLTWSPLAKLSRYTLFSLAGMFLVFAIWALFGFSYPFDPIPIALNAVSKVLSFVAAVTLFLPQQQVLREILPSAKLQPQ